MKLDLFLMFWCWTGWLVQVEAHLQYDPRYGQARVPFLEVLG